MEYIISKSITLIAASFLFAVFSILLREKAAERIRYISGIILTVYVIGFVSPIIKFAINTEFIPSEPSSPTVEDSESEKNMVQAISAQLCKDIKCLVINRFAIQESLIDISVTVEQLPNEEIALKSVTVKYHESGENTISDTDASVIAKYISDTVAAPCVILIEPKPQ